MIQVYVLVSFWDENGLHKAGTFTEVKEENFDPYYMQKVEGGSGDAYTKAETDALLDEKQDDLTAGTNIQISDEDVISATDTGDTVSVTQVQSAGTKIATVTVNSVGTDIYAPDAFVIAMTGTAKSLATMTYPSAIGVVTPVDTIAFNTAITTSRPIIFKFSDGYVMADTIFIDTDDKVRGTFSVGYNTIPDPPVSQDATLKIIAFEWYNVGDYVSMYVQDATPSGGGGGVDSSVIADEFDTTPVVTPSVYDEYDIVTKSGTWYWSMNNNNTEEPGTGSKWKASTVTVLDSYGSTVPAYGIAQQNSPRTFYINTTSSSQWVSPSQGQIPSGVIEGVNKGTWSAGTETYHSYAVGDYVFYEDLLYKCTSATTGESWESAAWDETQVMDEVSGGGSSGGAVTILTLNAGFDQISASGKTLSDGQGNPKSMTDVKTAFESGEVIIKDSNNNEAKIITVSTMPDSKFIVFGSNLQSFTYSGGYWSFEEIT